MAHHLHRHPAVGAWVVISISFTLTFTANNRPNVATFMLGFDVVIDASGQTGNIPLPYTVTISVVAKPGKSCGKHFLSLASYTRHSYELRVRSGL
jgi:hypothetical protein